jgi:hypothetical protein
MARSQSSAERRTKPDDPYRIGCRYIKRGKRYDMVPLTEEDLLYPQEGDQIVQNDLHACDVVYLTQSFRARAANQRSIRILSDHCIDFQIDGLQPLGPDITVLNGEPREWDRRKGTFPVVDMKARPLFVMEITSPNTRRKDFNEKLDLYYRAGVPLYIIVDAPYGGSKKPRGIVPYQAGPDKFELLAVDANGRFTLDIFDLTLSIVDGHILCVDADGVPIGDYLQIVAELDREKTRADNAEALAQREKLYAEQEKARAEQEKARAEQERLYAAQEKARAEAAEARIRELEALIKNPKRRKKS